MARPKNIDMDDKELLARRAVKAESDLQYARRKILEARITRTMRHTTQHETVLVLTQYIGLDELEAVARDLELKKRKA